MTEAEVARLYLEHGYFLYRRCLAYLGDSAAADDAVQEVFVRAIQGAARYRGEAAPRTWLCRIADHLCVDLLRRRRRNPVYLSPDGATVEPGVSMPLQCRIDDGESLLSAHQLLSRLSPDSQRLALLYYVDELTQEELAVELGVSRRTIGKWLQALVVKARELLGQEGVS